MDLAATDTDLPVSVMGEEASGEQGEERRRRRRRGGRNRNRRDRENGEAIAAGSESEDAEESADRTEAVQLELTEVAAASVQVVVETAKTPVSQAVSEQPAVVEAPAVRTDPEAAVAPTQAMEEMESPPVAAPATPRHEAVVMPAPVVEFKPAPVPAPVTTLAANPIVPAPMPIERLQEVLAAAGLTLAMTDPEKLRAAQEAAAKIVPPSRVPRERKPLPPLPTEPLIQIETRR